MKIEGTIITGYIGAMLGLYWSYIGLMEKKMETTIMSSSLKGIYGFSRLGDRRIWQRATRTCMYIHIEVDKSRRPSAFPLYTL